MNIIPEPKTEQEKRDYLVSLIKSASPSLDEEEIFKLVEELPIEEYPAFPGDIAEENTLYQCDSCGYTAYFSITDEFLPICPQCNNPDATYTKS